MGGVGGETGGVMASLGLSATRVNGRYIGPRMIRREEKIRSETALTVYDDDGSITGFDGFTDAGESLRVWYEPFGGLFSNGQADMKDIVKVPAINNKVWNTCNASFHPNNKYLEGVPRPSQMNVEYALAGSGNNPEMAAFVLAVWGRESAFVYFPPNDHGPMQLTSAVPGYYPKVKIEPGAYDPFTRPAEGRAAVRRTWLFTGSPLANIKTAVNWFHWRMENEKSDFYALAYGYGPGYLGKEKNVKKRNLLNKRARDLYAKETIKIFNMFKPLVNCITK
jgi:hypothetical protein